MAFLKPVVNGGFTYGNFQLSGTKSYVGDSEFIEQFTAVLQFFSQSDYFVGDIRLDHDNSSYLMLKIIENKIGGLDGFKFEVDKLPDFSFFNLMKVKIVLNNSHWYTGELLLSEQPDTRNPIKEFQGRGYIKYIDDIDNITITYESKTLKEIIVDQMETNIITNTPIEYDPDLINPPDITVTKLEFTKKSVKKIFQEVLEIANKDYDVNQYTYGVDKNLFFYFKKIDNEIKDGFFEGYQYQEPNVKQDDSKIINQIDIFRAKENSSDELELVDSIEDTESQSRYGLRKSKITVNEYIDDNTAINIASSKLNKFKNPFTQVDVKDIEIDNVYDIGFYNLSNRVQEYQKLVNDCEDLNLWDLNLGPSTIQLDNEEYISGKNSLKWESSDNAQGNSIELDLNESIMYPKTLRAYFKQNLPGEVINLTVYDEENNEISAGEMEFFNILAEDGSFLITEDNNFIIQEDTQQLGIDVKIIEDWFLFEFDVSSISNLKKIVYFVTTENPFILNLDRIEVLSKSYFTRSLVLEKSTYILDRTGIKFDGVFGEKIETIIDDIKKVEEKDEIILGLFQK